MTTRPPQQCTYCPHDLDPHQIYILDMERLVGICLCPVPGCTCGATVRASTTGPSTPEEIAETREIVRKIITDAGLPLPAFLR